MLLFEQKMVGIKLFLLAHTTWVILQIHQNIRLVPQAQGWEPELDVVAVCDASPDG